MQVVIFGFSGPYVDFNCQTLPLAHNGNGILSLLFGNFVVRLENKHPITGIDEIMVCHENIMFVGAEKVSQQIFDNYNAYGGAWTSIWNAFQEWAKIHNFSFTPINTGAF